MVRNNRVVRSGWRAAKVAARVLVDGLTLMGFAHMYAPEAYRDWVRDRRRAADEPPHEYQVRLSPAEQRTWSELMRRLDDPA
jgi:hypothetical protein